GGDHRGHRGAAQHRLPAGDLRRGLRSDPISHADLRSRHGYDHDLEAARPDLDTGSDRRSDQAQAHFRGPCGAGRGARLMADMTTDPVKPAAGGRRWETDPVLTVEHLTMRFGGLIAINDVSFQVGRGDITALIGPNGAGKTTAFHCLTGFYKPTAG